jgi:hypothetical protein
MPATSMRRPVAFASAAISIIVFEPSWKLASIFGFIRFDAASTAHDSGVAVGMNGLFFPFPAATTSKESSVAKSNSSFAHTGSSPSATE